MRRCLNCARISNNESDPDRLGIHRQLYPVKHNTSASVFLMSHVLKSSSLHIFLLKKALRHCFFESPPICCCLLSLTLTVVWERQIHMCVFLNSRFIYIAYSMPNKIIPFMSLLVNIIFSQCLCISSVFDLFASPCLGCRIDFPQVSILFLCS